MSLYACCLFCILLVEVYVSDACYQLSYLARGGMKIKILSIIIIVPLYLSGRI